MKRNIILYFLLLCSISIFAQGVVTPPRTCAVCKETKPASEFSGQSKTCKACAKKKPETRTCSSCKKTKALNAFSGNSKICKACTKPITVTSGDYVDLGLPSGTLWASKNVGANSPEDYGDYFALGETKGYKSGKVNFDINAYKWKEDGYYEMQKNNKKLFVVSDEVELAIEDDAAYVNRGNQWHMPNSNQIKELKEHCKWTWTTYKGARGYLVKGRNGNSIFLPAAGGRHKMSLDNEGKKGYYWSRVLKTNKSLYAFSWIFLDDMVVEHNCCNYDSYSYFGFSVRPVRISQQEAEQIAAREQAEKERIAREQAEKESMKFKDLGDDYRYGRNGKSKDYVEAVKWYRKAAEQGCAEAQYNLGFMYASGDGVTQNYSEAVKWCRKAAEQGNADAHNALGNMYMMGRGVTKDYTEAVKWFSKAAEQGDTNAQNNLGRVYHEGLGVTKNDIEAVKWFRKSAEQGNVHAQINMSYMYEFGYGVTKDISQSKYWCEKAAAQGNEYAKKKLKDLKKK